MVTTTQRHRAQARALSSERLGVFDTGCQWQHARRCAGQGQCNYCRTRCGRRSPDCRMRCRWLRLICSTTPRATARSTHSSNVGVERPSNSAGRRLTPATPIVASHRCAWDDPIEEFLAGRRRLAGPVDCANAKPSARRRRAPEQWPWSSRLGEPSARSALASPAAAAPCLAGSTTRGTYALLPT